MVYHRSSEKKSQEVAEPKNFFRNDGSFLEMFKKMQETSAASSSSSNNNTYSSTSSLPSVKKESTTATSVSDSIKPEPKEKLHTSEGEGKITLNNKFPIFGKRRGGRALPIGKVKKVKVEPKQEEVEEPKDAWSQYLAEVKKYKETTCEEEGKTRPLVK
ncbi:telomerase RNA component interacting RNase-like [Lycorma delicatula]|uniref:telomerase RNA component interacting RNase-like n=1 Tax=Lycorma delicatula TaxID=130591 RepID=UPI003F5155AF